MRNKRLQLVLGTLVAGWLLCGMAGLYGCASIGAPTGGPKDSLPPVLVKALPQNFTPNFTRGTITLDFDEFVELDNVFEKLIINPPLNKFPVVERKLRTVTVKIKDSLEANTTYSLRFDKVIKDVNEGNPFGNYTYVFSTGSRFDSATFSGRVIDAETGKADSTLLVLLHRDLSDTAVVKLKPRYITRLDSAGFFRFNYLAPGTYNVFALKDEGMKRYSDSTIPFAFYNTPIEVKDSTAPVQLYFFSGEKKEEKPAEPPVQQKPVKKTDEEEEEARRLQVSLDLNNGKQDAFTPLQIVLSNKLARFDSSKVAFTDTLGRPLQPYAITLDSTGKRISLAYKWKLETTYQLVFDRAFATDTAGMRPAATDTVRFETKGEADYGSVRMTFTGLEGLKNPVLVWLDGGKIYKSFSLASGRFSDKYFKPGEYEIRILMDDNNNGLWDRGNYRLKQQPERNLYVPQKINVRANWDNEFTIDLGEN